ncbi:MAG: acyltransferase family protein [Solobacterium sp.]|nr:acyltransferase family protein [Solobacterium sp.]
MKKKYDAIDIAKFVASLVVFTQHCGPFKDYPALAFYYEIISRWVVPFFFISSAYFLFRKSVNGVLDQDTLNHYLKRLGILYGCWFLINIPYIYLEKLEPEDLSAISTWLIFIKNSLLTSTFTGSWYLVSSLFSAWAVNSLAKKFKTGQVMLITFAMYAVCVFSSAYMGLVPKPIAEVLLFLCFPRNIFNGCFFFALGKYFAENEEKLIARFPIRKALIWLVVSYVLFFSEVFIAQALNIFETAEATFANIGPSWFLFLICFQIAVSIKHGGLLRKLSTIIYCCQANVLIINKFLKKGMGVTPFKAWLVCWIPVVLICALVLFLQNHTKWKWPQYLT